MELEPFVTRGVPEEALSAESPGQPTLSKGNSPDCAIIIADGLPELDADTDGIYGYWRDLDLGTQDRDGSGAADLLTEDKLEGMEDAISSELVDRPESQANGRPRCELSPTSSTPPTTSPDTEIGQTTEGGRNDTLTDATTDQSSQLVHKIVEVQDEYAPLVMTSTCSGSNRLDSTTNTNNAVDDKDDSTNSKNRMGKRKRSLFPQPTESASTSSKRFLTNTGRLRPKRNHPSHSELPFGGSSDPTAPPPARDRSHDDDNDSRRNSGHGRHFGSNKRLELGHGSHGKTRKRDRGRRDEEKE
ncbi:hypothetical protein BDV95DRAFT_663683, partial [Massariosphaeria phaeospora]